MRAAADSVVTGSLRATRQSTYVHQSTGCASAARYCHERQNATCTCQPSNPGRAACRAQTGEKPAASQASCRTRQAKPAAPAPEKKVPLELSLHPDVFDPLQPLEPLNDLSTPLLPPLFVEKTEPESPFQLNGKLITNERGDDYWQSVEGAQLQFEFKQ